MSVRCVAVYVGVLASAIFACRGYAQFETPEGLQAVPSGNSPQASTQQASTSQDPPSLQAQGSASGANRGGGSAAVQSQRALSQPGGAVASRGGAGGGELPNNAGQIYDTLDLRPYTGYLTKHDRPHQAIVDWVLRDTGTDMWFTEPFGFLNANRDSLTVYHTPEMHAVVRDVVDKFVAGTKDPQTIGLRVMTVGSPNWRARAIPLMEHVNVGSPGVQAWLVTKENTAVLLSLLRQRTDAREVQAIDISLYNGQTESLASTRRRNYVRNIRSAPTGWPPYEPELGEVEEGYKLEISPLLNTDGRTLDCVIQAEIDQVEQLVPVELDLPLPNGQLHRTRIEVPQVISWRLHERFRWPMDRVLVLSCGVVASPDRPQSAVPFLNLESITGQTAGRADALLFVEFKGRAAENLPLGPRTANPTTGFSRGRY